jgi:hypothetical protein
VVASGARRWIAPHFGTLFVVMHLVAALGRAVTVLGDPGTGWHLATGHLILDTGAIPRTDPFSFTAAGRDWVNYYWLFEVVSAAAERLGGLPLFAALWTFVYGLIPFVVYRNAVRAGASPLAALPLTVLAHLVLLSHSLARPHAVTYVLFAIVVGRALDVAHGRSSVRSLWWMPFVAAVWANTHGGFLTGLFAVAVVTGATGLEWLVHRRPEDLRRATALAGLFAAMAAATLVNPYGFHLHVQAIEHLGLPSTGYFAEFRTPDFRNADTTIRGFELLILSLLALGMLGALRLGWAETGLAIGTLHLALTAVRNQNLFAIVATPLVARGLGSFVVARWPRLGARWQTIAEEQDAQASHRVQLPALAAVLFAFAAAGRLPFPTTLDGLRLTAGAAAHLDAHAERYQRMFNQDAFGGPLIYRLWPKLHVYVDDRSAVVYGEEFMMRDYLPVVRGHADWADALARHGVTTAIVETPTVIASLLRASPDWTIDYADDRNVIFSRVGSPPPSGTPPT